VNLTDKVLAYLQQQFDSAKEAVNTDEATETNPPKPANGE
jgi:hypothetical protein